CTAMSLECDDPISFFTHYSLCHVTHTLSFFFFNATATPEIYTLSLHDALPIYREIALHVLDADGRVGVRDRCAALHSGDIDRTPDRKSTRLNSSHDQISYAVFCLKKKNKNTYQSTSKDKNITQLTQIPVTR